MSSVKCNKCGFIFSSEKNGIFCPNCGSPVEQQPGTENIGLTNNCPVCGAAIEVASAKFCQNCGTPFPQASGQVAGQAVAPPAPFNASPQYSAPTFAPPPQDPFTVPQKLVAGALVKSVPFANMIVKEGKISGSIQLRRDGVLFITAAKQVIQSHLLDIADVTEAGEKNVIKISMTNGEARTFAFAGASRWIEKIYGLQGR